MDRKDMLIFLNYFFSPSFNCSDLYLLFSCANISWVTHDINTWKWLEDSCKILTKVTCKHQDILIILKYAQNTSELKNRRCIEQLRRLWTSYHQNRFVHFVRQFLQRSSLVRGSTVCANLCNHTKEMGQQELPLVDGHKEI